MAEVVVIATPILNFILSVFCVASGWPSFAAFSNKANALRRYAHYIKSEWWWPY